MSEGFRQIGFQSGAGGYGYDAGNSIGKDNISIDAVPLLAVKSEGQRNPANDDTPKK